MTDRPDTPDRAAVRRALAELCDVCFVAGIGDGPKRGKEIDAAFERVLALAAPTAEREALSEADVGAAADRMSDALDRTPYMRDGMVDSETLEILARAALAREAPDA